ncbi:MAG TPA: hypothetical protein VER03_06465 [Bryobacteraceae bacterium]|nr:hypothetical protein [Bryobacteraceae bacterium]
MEAQPTRLSDVPAMAIDGSVVHLNTLQRDGHWLSLLVQPDGQQCTSLLRSFEERQKLSGAVAGG